MFRIVVHIILVLVLSALIGSLLFFGAGVAPAVFRPDLLPSRTLAGAVNAAVLHRLNVVAGVCAVILPLALGYLAFTVPRSGSRVAFGFGVAITIVVLYMGLKLFPDVNALRLEIGDFDHILAVKESLLDRFHDLHKLYTRLAQGVLFAAVGILIAHVVLLARGFNRHAAARGDRTRGDGARGEGAKGDAGKGDTESGGNEVENVKPASLPPPADS